ncbi:unnamed protein product [Soboliphyme baturini]|uniref:Trafficking protein particle complex subunit 8 n=1 Tax=Soboliphyme baturini TaxID=241478 RepID=A0A183IJG9_9BILA|nr:unnamed protein product [Soboliphyme baturini]
MLIFKHKRSAFSPEVEKRVKMMAYWFFFIMAAIPMAPLMDDSNLILNTSPLLLFTYSYLSTLSMDISQFPQELTSPALQLVFMMGLDVHNNPSHKTVCDMFTKGWRSDPLPLNFCILTDVQDLQKVKTQANESRGSVDGILKINWMKKHLSSIPAVVVLFVDLDWQHPSWNEKILECRSKVESIRECIASRSSILALVLIQSVPPIPSGL